MRRGLRVAAAAVATLSAVLLGPGAGPASATPGPSDAPQWWFDSWDVPGLWAAGARGQGVTIAVVDTGVTVVPQLAGRVLPGTDLGDLGGDGRTDRDNDEFGHGTAMASIMVAAPGPFGIEGLAPGAQVLPIAVPLDNTAEAGQPDRVTQAIRYAADHGAKIINLSLGGNRSPKEDELACPVAEQQAVYYALGKGAVLVAAAGNEGPTRNSVEDPAACLGVLTVGAQTRGGAVADFSTRQPYVSLLAPGVDIPSLGRVAGDAYSGDGTSQASAITSAALALVWSAHPRLTGPQVVARVLATLDQRTATPTPTAGYGLLDAGRAVRASVPATASDPVAETVSPFLRRFADLQAAVPSPSKATGRSRLGTVVVGSRDSSHGTAVGVALLAGGGLLVLAAALVLLTGRRRRPAPAVLEPPETG